MAQELTLTITDAHGLNAVHYALTMKQAKCFPEGVSQVIGQGRGKAPVLYRVRAAVTDPWGEWTDPLPEAEQNLNRALRWVRSELAKRSVDYNSHRSHLVAVVLSEAEVKFGLDTCGVEGWCDGLGKAGVQYLNTGDSYGLTIVVRAGRDWHRASLGAWADFASHK